MTPQQQEVGVVGLQPSFLLSFVGLLTSLIRDKSLLEEMIGLAEPENSDI